MLGQGIGQGPEAREEYTSHRIWPIHLLAKQSPCNFLVSDMKVWNLCCNG